MVSETSPRCRPDILERAKAADIDSLAGTDWGALREIVQGLIAEVERLRSDMQAILVDHEVPGWAEDFRRLNDGSAFPVFEVAKKWHAAYRKAQNSNLIRKKQTEDQDARIKELEALNESLIENGNDLRARCWKAEARIKKPEAKNARLDAAFLKLYVNQLVGCNMPREVAEKHARKALEIIKEGGKDE